MEKDWHGQYLASGLPYSRIYVICFHCVALPSARIKLGRAAGFSMESLRASTMMCSNLSLRCIGTFGHRNPVFAAFTR